MERDVSAKELEKLTELSDVFGHNMTQADIDFLTDILTPYGKPDIESFNGTDILNQLADAVATARQISVSNARKVLWDDAEYQRTLSAWIQLYFEDKI